MNSYPKRLIEVDLPIKKISAHARREKSIRHGHISTLHIWWARRPLGACRAVICAALWLDPVDENCPQVFRDKAIEYILAFAKKMENNKDLANSCATEHWNKWLVLAKPKNELNKNNPQHLNVLRNSLLDFIADFANWDNSTQPDYLETSRKLTQAAHEALGGIPDTRPLVVDPFAGGGSIPLEALRIGADAFASDLNPVAVLLNKVVLEYIPKYGQELADQVRKWGQWIKDEAEKELSEFYPKDEDGSTPIAYLWARTIVCEGPGCGAEVPLMRSLWLAKKSNRSIALQIIPKSQEKRIDFVIIEKREKKWVLVDHPEKEIKKPNLDGTVKRGSATCPCCGFTTPVASVRIQLKSRHGGADDARLFCVVLTKPAVQGRFYRLPNEKDLKAVIKAKKELEKRKKEYKGEFSLVPNEPLPPQGALGFRVQLYGMEKWGNLFTARQSLTLTTLTKLVKEVGKKLTHDSDQGLAIAVQTCLSFAIDRQANTLTSLSRWNTAGEKIEGLFARQAIPMVWDVAEANSFSGSTGGLNGALEWILNVCEANLIIDNIGQAQQVNAVNHPLPNDFIQAFITDPPYYDAIPYSDLSDFFYVWLKRTLHKSISNLFSEELTPKQDECIVDEVKGKDKAYFEKTMGLAMAEGRRILSLEGIGIIVFAHKSTSGWEAQLQAMVDAGWTMTASWSIDTEMGNRLRAHNSAALASSVHLVCRPRNNHEIGDWQDILQELPPRIHEWMPRLAGEGVVGADAIFACLGPALEIFSRYDSVEKVSGDIVTLKEYLEYVWAAVSKEALGMIFSGADATGFEEDARITAMWLWTLSTGTTIDKDTISEDDSPEEDDDDTNKKTVKISGYLLEFDTARKIAQGLGVHLEKLSSLIHIKGDKATLLSVSARKQYLFGKNTEQITTTNQKKNVDKQLSFELTGNIGKIPLDESTDWGETDPNILGKTILDQIHQSMILFGAGRSEAIKTLLVHNGIGKDQRFWTLAQSLSALYPPGTDEKRWVDGVLARKKGLGL
jgi:putative DNA methylase